MSCSTGCHYALLDDHLHLSICLNRAIVDYQHGRLQDHATAILAEWQPGQAGHDLTP